MSDQLITNSYSDSKQLILLLRLRAPNLIIHLSPNKYEKTASSLRKLNHLLFHCNIYNAMNQCEKRI